MYRINTAYYDHTVSSFRDAYECVKAGWMVEVRILNFWFDLKMLRFISSTLT